MSFGCQGCMMKKMAKGDKRPDESCMPADLQKCWVSRLYMTMAYITMAYIVMA